MNSPEHPTLMVGVALSAAIGAGWLGWLPPLVALGAGLFSLAWYGIQIWESSTGRGWRRSLGWHVPARNPED